MTIDEAIAHAQETADTRTDLCDECRMEHGQLAQWLIELKQLREESSELKKLLKLAVEDFEYIFREHSCTSTACRMFCPYSSGRTDECNSEWKHAEEALKLIGDEGNA